MSVIDFPLIIITIINKALFHIDSLSYTDGVVFTTLQ